MSREDVNCKKLWELLSDYIDGELSVDLCRKIEQHLAECEHCRVVLDTTHKTICICHCDADETELPADVRRRLFERLHIEDDLKPKSA